MEPSHPNAYKNRRTFKNQEQEHKANAKQKKNRQRNFEKKMGKGGNLMTASEVEELRRKNGEMEKEVEEMKKEMLQLWRRTQVAEEAEERLCSQLAELEAESLDEARDYHSRIIFLVNELSRVSSSSSSSSSDLASP